MDTYTSNKFKTNLIFTYHIKDMLYVSSCKKYIRITAYTGFLSFAILLLIMPFILTSNKQVQRRHKYPTDMKYILFWSHEKNRKTSSSLNKSYEVFQPGQTSFIQQKCPHFNCYLTYDKNLLADSSDYDAVIFDVKDVENLDINDLNMTRSPDQLYIFKSSASAAKYPLCHKELDGFFNLTWSYKLNSDLPEPFFSIFSTNNNNKYIGPRIGVKWLENRKRKVDKRLFKSKTKAIAWVPPKCNLKAKYADFLKDLRSELKGYRYSVDILGKCGSKCPGNGLNKCQKLVKDTYYFQLVIEEYLSEDYVTADMVNVMSTNAIPLVFGATDYSNFLPSGSYVNVQAFNMKKLGALIDYLIKNHEMYAYFLDWKTYYQYKLRDRTRLCDLCTKLYQHNGTAQCYKRFRKWWDPEYKDVCQRKQLLEMFNKDETKKRS